MTHILLAATTTLALISVSATAAAEDSGGTETSAMVCTGPKALSADAVYIGGATIIALAAFGSALSTKIVVNRDKNAEKVGAGLIALGAGTITAAQVFIMWHACCGDLSCQTLLAYLGLTGVAVVLIILGFALTRYSQPEKDSKGPDRGQPPAQDGASTKLHFQFKSGRGTSDMSFNHSGGKS